jgi:putative hydrolase of the HAD superfamily
MIRPQAIAAALAAKAAGCKLAILSNELDLFYGRELRQRVPVLRQFDCIVDATYTGILKPDPRAYALCLEQLDLPAGACVFIDDQSRNVEGALQVGMRALAFDVLQPSESYRLALRALGVPIPVALQA